mmetsp:Transcript_4755/g.15106  ORF Transcript_4755/g.15106 Transcript_4755/m.15106 type:complete len:204 (-) Transcript_4755:2580-3191(-)
MAALSALQGVFELTAAHALSACFAVANMATAERCRSTQRTYGASACANTFSRAFSLRGAEPSGQDSLTHRSASVASRGSVGCSASSSAAVRRGRRLDTLAGLKGGTFAGNGFKAWARCCASSFSRCTASSFSRCLASSCLCKASGDSASSCKGAKAKLKGFSSRTMRSFQGPLYSLTAFAADSESANMTTADLLRTWHRFAAP